MHITSSSYVMTQGPGGVPVAIPMQSGDGRVQLQYVTPGIQEGQPQMVVVRPESDVVAWSGAHWHPMVSRQTQKVKFM